MFENVDAIVLAAAPLGESDRRLALLTRERGRLYARAAGVRRPGARLAAAAQPTVHARFRLWRAAGSAGGRVAGGALADGHPGFRRDWRRQTAALILCETVDRFTPLLQPADDVFDLLRRALSALEGGDPAVIRAAFAVQFARLAGYGLGVDGRWSGLDEWNFQGIPLTPPETVSAAEHRAWERMEGPPGRPPRALAHGRALERFLVDRSAVGVTAGSGEGNS